MELVGGCKNCFMDCLRQSKTFKAYSRHTFLLFNILQQMLSNCVNSITVKSMFLNGELLNTPICLQHLGEVNWCLLSYWSVDRFANVEDLKRVIVPFQFITEVIPIIPLKYTISVKINHGLSRYLRGSIPINFYC